MRTRDDLRKLQALPLELKIKMMQRRIRDWVKEYGEDGVYVSFSGGKDSTVLLHIVREMYPDTEAVFVNTGLEYPEIQKFVKSFDNVTILRPKMRFDEVIKRYGFPMISKEISQKVHDATNKHGGTAYQKLAGTFSRGEKKNTYYPAGKPHKYFPLVEKVDFRVSHYCCEVMKKRPAKEFEKQSGKKPILATMASESLVREQQWLRSGCNAYENKRERSAPMSFWTEQDVLRYIKENSIPIASVYGDIVYAENPEQIRLEEMGVEGCGEKLCTTGCSRTGCIFCGFGCHLDKEPSRFQRLKETHPRQYEYCIGGGEYDADGIWKPNKGGLGMGHVFEELNKIYGEGFIKY